MITSHFENIEEVILRELENSQSSIKVAVAWLTSKNIIICLCRKAKKGIPVSVVLSNDKINEFKDFYLKEIIQNGGELYKYSQTTMHNKFCVIDEKIVITGSYNWSQNAAYNKENIMVVKEEKITTTEYLNEFQKIKSNSTKVVNDRPKLILKKEAPKLSKTPENLIEIRLRDIGYNLTTAKEKVEKEFENAEEIMSEPVFHGYKGSLLTTLSGINERIYKEDYISILRKMDLVNQMNYILDKEDLNKLIRYRNELSFKEKRMSFIWSLFWGHGEEILRLDTEIRIKYGRFVDGSIKIRVDDGLPF